MDDTGILGGALGQLGQTAKQAVKQVVKLPGQMARDAGEQIGGVPLRQSSDGQAKPAVSSESKQKQWQSDEERIKFLKDLYGKTDAPKSLDKKPTEFQEQIKDKSPEEQQELMSLRSQLHKENYYDPTFNPVKKQEERPAEKVEQEKEKEMQDLQEKKEKAPPPLAAVREQNKAEMFRGASG